MGSTESDEEGGQEPPELPGGAVAEAARVALSDMQSDHAAAPLLQAIVERLCVDIDQAPRIPERISATRMVLQLLEVLDGAMFASTRVPDAPGDTEEPDPEAEDPDDPFKVGQLPPGVGDPPA